MGAAASTSRGANSSADPPDAAWPGGPSAKDYYALLDIEETATETDVRKAFRKLALIHVCLHAPLPEAETRATARPKRSDLT